MLSYECSLKMAQSNSHRLTAAARLYIKNQPGKISGVSIIQCWTATCSFMHCWIRLRFSQTAWCARILNETSGGCPLFLLAKKKSKHCNCQKDLIRCSTFPFNCSKCFHVQPLGQVNIYNTLPRSKEIHNHSWSNFSMKQINKYFKSAIYMYNNHQSDKKKKIALIRGLKKYSNSKDKSKF